NTWWRLIDPYGNMLFSNRFNVDSGRLTLPAGGAYAVLVEGDVRDTGTVGYSFNVAPVTDTTQPLTLGSSINGTLAGPGQQDRYRFTLAADSLLYFDSRTNSGSFQWSLTGPMGVFVNSATFNTKFSFNASDGFSSGNPSLALPAGDYTLTVFGLGQTAGGYAFRLSDLAAATPLTPGTPVSGTLNPANGSDLY